MRSTMSSLRSDVAELGDAHRPKLAGGEVVALARGLGFERFLVVGGGKAAALRAAAGAPAGALVALLVGTGHGWGYLRVRGWGAWGPGACARREMRAARAQAVGDGASIDAPEQERQLGCPAHSGAWPVTRVGPEVAARLPSTSRSSP